LLFREDGDVASVAFAGQPATLAYAVARKWKLVLAVAVVVAIAAVGYALRATPVYSAESSIVLLGAKYKITLDPKFATIDPALATQASTLATRLEEYRAVLLSADVRQAALQQLSGLATDRDLDDVSVRAKGTLLSISARSSDPALAQKIASAYATAAAKKLDNVYGVADQDQAALARSLADAVAEHEKAEARVADFLRTSNIDALTRERDRLVAARDTLTKAQNQALREQLARYTLATSELDALKRDAEALRASVASSAGSQPGMTANAVALIGLENRLVNVASMARPLDQRSASGQVPDGQSNPSAAMLPRNQNPYVLQLTADSIRGGVMDRDQFLKDVDTLLAGIAARQQEFSADYRQMLDRSATTADGVASLQPEDRQQLERLDARIGEIESQLRNAVFQRDVLLQQAEAKKSARSTLETKVQESNIALATNSEGKALVAADATLPTGPVYPPPIPLVGLVGGLAGAVLAAAGVCLWQLAGSGATSRLNQPATPERGAVGAVAARPTAPR